MSPTESLQRSIALSFVEGLGPVTFRKLMQLFGDVNALWKAPASRWSAVGLGKGWYERVHRKELLHRADRVLKATAAQNISVIAVTDSRYPAILKAIYDPPMVLYVKGNVFLEWPRCVAVVGSRRASLYGWKQAGRLAEALARSGVVVVSGLARGIDAAAHEGALAGNSPTLAVLGGGFSHLYPAEHKKLAERILQKGALVSKHPMDVRPRPEFFPRRNRILSGLSQGVVVIEASQKSGALITAESALEQGREVMAFPANADAVNAQGTNALLKDGAHLVRNAEDVCEILGIAPVPAAAPEEAGWGPRRVKVSAEEKALLAGLTEESVPADRVIRKSRFSAGKTMALLTGLEIKGRVKQLPGNRFARTSDA